MNQGNVSFLVSGGEMRYVATLSN